MVEHEAAKGQEAFSGFVEELKENEEAQLQVKFTVSASEVMMCQ